MGVGRKIRFTFHIESGKRREKREDTKFKFADSLNNVSKWKVVVFEWDEEDEGGR